MEKRIEGDLNLVRDPHSGAIINSNSKAYQAALNRKELRKKIHNIEIELNALEIKIEKTQSSIMNIMNLIETIINKLDK